MIGLHKEGLKAYVSEYVTIAADEAGLGVKSKRNRWYVFKRIEDFLGEMPFTYEGIRDYITHLREHGIDHKYNKILKPWGNESIGKEITLIRAFLKYCVKHKYISTEEDFSERLTKPKVHEKVRELPSLADAVRIIIAGTEVHPNRPGLRGDNGINAQHKVDCREAMLFVIDTGVRYAEVRSITSNRVYLNSSVPYLTIDAKGGNEAKIPIPHQQIEVVNRRCRNNLAGGRIFPITDKTCNISLKRGALLLGLPKITIHDLRRIPALNMSDNGANDYQIKDFLRHTSVLTTQRYVKHDLGRVSTISNKYQDRNRCGLPVDKALDFIESENKRLVGSDERFNMSIERENDEMVIRFTSKS